MPDPIEEVVNLESATAEELGRLLTGQQPDAGEQPPNPSQGPQRAKAEDRELQLHRFDLPEGVRHPK